MGMASWEGNPFGESVPPAPPPPKKERKNEAVLVLFPFNTNQNGVHLRNTQMSPLAASVLKGGLQLTSDQGVNRFTPSELRLRFSGAKHATTVAFDCELAWKVVLLSFP